MKTDNIYEEKLFSKWITIILAVVAVVFLFAFIYQVLIEPIGYDPTPNWFFLLMFLFFLGLTVNFSNLSIKITSQSIIIGYGIFINKLLWENIEGCYLDKTPAIIYGGWGIRIGRVNRKWRLIYNTIGDPRVVLSLKKGKFFKEFVFSTKNPEKVMEIIKENIKVEQKL